MRPSFMASVVLAGLLFQILRLVPTGSPGTVQVLSQLGTVVCQVPSTGIRIFPRCSPNRSVQLSRIVSGPASDVPSQSAISVRSGDSCGGTWGWGSWAPNPGIASRTVNAPANTVLSRVGESQPVEKFTRKLHAHSRAPLPGFKVCLAEWAMDWDNKMSERGSVRNSRIRIKFRLYYCEFRKLYCFLVISANRCNNLWLFGSSDCGSRSNV
jgi:hypothetical protein